jgi:hypothetical protein
MDDASSLIYAHVMESRFNTDMIETLFPDSMF